MSFKLPAFFDKRVQKPVIKNENGRIRSKEHIPGNWPTIIFIPINLPEDNVLLINHKVKSLFDMKFDPIDPIIPQSSYHLSLSRTLYVKDHQRDLFQSKITAALKKALTEFPLPEQIETENFSAYLNDEKSRTFVAIDLKNDENILKFIEAIDNVLKEFGLPVYYASPKLHFSIVWCQGNRQSELVFAENEEKINFTVKTEQILMKCGNKITKIS